MKLFVDRISEGLAVCETEEQTFKTVPLELLPPETREGSVLLENDGVFLLDPTKEEARRHRLFALQNELFFDDDT